MRPEVVLGALLALASLLVGACRADNLDYAVAEINRQVLDTRAFLTSKGVPFYDDQLRALSALQYCARVSVPGWRYRAANGMALPPGSTFPEIAHFTVSYEVGLCGNAAILFHELTRRVGCQVRKVDAWYGPPGTGHAMAEVYYGGQWRLYDPLWGRYWRDPARPWWDAASAVEVATSMTGDIWEVGNTSHLWRRVCDETANPDSGLRWWWMTPLVIKTGSTVLYSR